MSSRNFALASLSSRNSPKANIRDPGATSKRVIAALGPGISGMLPPG